jgi:hypothetical protein
VGAKETAGIGINQFVFHRTDENFLKDSNNGTYQYGDTGVLSTLAIVGIGRTTDDFRVV